MKPLFPITGVEIVPHGNERMFVVLRGDPAAHRQAGRVVRGAHLVVGRRDADEDRVVVAVEVALELEDLGLPGEAAGEPHRVHRRLGAAAREADLVGRRDQSAERLRDLDLERAAGGEDAALRRLVGDGSDDRRVVVAQHHWSEAHDHVDEPVPVDVRDVGALTALEVDRVGPEAARPTDR
jgi:hypothetical protein